MSTVLYDRTAVASAIVEASMRDIHRDADKRCSCCAPRSSIEEHADVVSLLFRH
jgi:hypothetical protein